MNDYIFELNITRIPQPVDETMSIATRVSRRVYNMAQRRTYVGLVKFFVDGFKIKRDRLTDDDIQIITVKGTKEYCEQIKSSIEGIDAGEINKFANDDANKTFFKRIGKKVTDVIDSTKSSSFEAFKQSMAAGGIMIMLSVHPLEAISSTVERLPYTQKEVGSTPSSPSSLDDKQNI